MPDTRWPPPQPRPHSLPQGQLQNLLVSPRLLQAAAHPGQKALQVACLLGLLLPQLPPQLPDVRLPGEGGQPDMRYEVGPRSRGAHFSILRQHSKRLGHLGHRNLFMPYRVQLRLPPPPGTFPRCALSLPEPPQHFASPCFGDELWQGVGWGGGIGSLTTQGCHLPSLFSHSVAV